MILIGQFDSPYVRRVAVTLNHYHMPFTRNPLSVFRNQPETQAINPLIRVPSLILDTGEVLIDSGAIIDHLDHVAGHVRALTPGDGPERRKVLKFVALATGAMDKAVALVYERKFHTGKMISKEWEDRCHSQLAATLTELEKNCGTPWFIDLHMTQADISIGCMLGFLKLRVPEAFPTDKFPKLHALSRHCEMREEFAEARISPDEI
ncbi:MAG: glutathione S-transferase family protein [Aestuariivirga sp.]